MGQINDIITGHVNEILGREEDLFEERMAICVKCPLYKETAVGPICNPNLYLNVEDGVTTSRYPKVGFRKGCSCRLNAAVRTPNKRCVVGK